MTVAALRDIGMGVSETEARGCRFCEAKAVHYAPNGMEFWHAATDCCAPTLVLQAVWRKQDHDRQAQEIDRTADPAVRRDMTEMLADLNAEYQRCVTNLLEAVDSEDALEAAIRQAVAAGFREDYRGVRATFAGRRYRGGA